MKFICEIILKILRVFSSQYSSLMDKIYYHGLGKRFKFFGKDVHIHYPCKITGINNIEIGNNVHVNRNAFISGGGGLVIEDNVHIARNLTIYTQNHNYKGRALPYDETHIKKKVVIGENVWIGINVTIVPGVKIGFGSIIGAGSVISQDVPPLSIVGTSTQRILKRRDKNHYNNLESKSLYGGRDGLPYKS